MPSKDPSYSLVANVDSSLWDRFIQESRQGNIFMHRDMLDALYENYHLLLLEQDDEIVAGAAIVFEDGKVLSAPHPNCPYLGIALAGSHDRAPSHRRSAWTPRTTEAFLECLAQRYERLSFGLHPRFEDLRGLQWFRYNEPADQHFRLTLRYTGLIDLTGTENWDAYLKNIRKNHGRDERRAIRLGYVLEHGDYADDLVDLSVQSFQRQGLQLDDTARERMHRVASAAVKSGFGECIAARNKAGDIASVGLFLFDNHTTYYMAAGTRPDERNSNCHTLVILEAIRNSRDRGSMWFDVIGINSPMRGDFKTSFNAKPTPYFVANWDSPARSTIS